MWQTSEVRLIPFQVGKSNFGKTLGVEDNLYVMLSLTSIALPVLKGLRLLSFG